MSKPEKRIALIKNSSENAPEHFSWVDDSENSPVYHLLKQMEELASRHRKMERISMARKRMLGLTSHDLLSPINAISGYLDLMKLAINTDADINQIGRYRSQIKNGITELVNIVHQLQEMSSSEDYNDMLSLPHDVDLNWVCRDVCDVMEGAAIAKDHDLITSYSHKPMYVMADLNQLKRILYNLISNAIKYTPRGGKICVSVEKSKTEARVMVQDNGIGIPEKEFSNIFLPNKKLNFTGTENESASGLGLYISAHFATLMNGQITLDSTVSEGSCFILHLPISNDANGLNQLEKVV